MKHLYADFIAGWLGGAAGLIVGHPMDTIKVRWQTSQYKSVMNCVYLTLRQENITAFFKGMAAPSLTAGLMNSVLFAGYGITLKYLNPGQKISSTYVDLPFSQIFIASSVGAVLQWFVAVPVELVKVKLQVQRESTGHFWLPNHGIASVEVKNRLYLGPVDCVRKMYREYGIQRGLYRGGLVQLQRDLIGFQFYMPVYELVLRWIRSPSGDNELFATVIAGGLSGITSWLSIMPWDVVKNRMQAQDWHKPKYTSAIDCFRKTYAEEGVRTFYKGSTITAVRAFPANAAVITVYTRCMQYLDN